MAFDLFPNLPPEIRHQIWDHAMVDLDSDNPVVFTYKPGCWKEDTLETVPEDCKLPSTLPDNTDVILHSFHHNQLFPVQVRVALQSVNHEARYCVERRLIRSPYITAFQPSPGFDDQHLASLSATFNPQRDCLYVDWTTFAHFLSEPISSISNHNVDVYGTISPITFLALPLRMLRDYRVRYALTFMLKDIFPMVKEVWAVLGDRPRRQHRLAPWDSTINRRWELETGWTDETRTYPADVDGRRCERASWRNLSLYGTRKRIEHGINGVLRRIIMYPRPGVRVRMMVAVPR